MTRILVIPDCQVKPGVPLDHLVWAGQYAVDKRPDIIVNLGDFWDMCSLSSYDRGKGSAEGRRYLADIDAGKGGLASFMLPLLSEPDYGSSWRPRLVFLEGNHEERIRRAGDEDVRYEGLITSDHIIKPLAEYGWEFHSFLEVVTIEGVAFSHFFTSGCMGRPVSSARALLNKKHQSAVMGHVQDRDIAYAQRADGTRMTALFAGIFYLHDEDYLGPQGNKNWRGCWMLNEVHDGGFDECPVSMNYLRRKYGNS